MGEQIFCFPEMPFQMSLDASPLACMVKWYE